MDQSVPEEDPESKVSAPEWRHSLPSADRWSRPIMGLIGGVQAPPGRVMGHAGAFVTAGEPDARTKIRALEDAGVVMANHPAKFGEGMRKLLGSISSSTGTVSMGSSPYPDKVKNP